MTDRLSRRALAAGTLVLPAAACATALDISPSFDWAWQAHIAAVRARDLAALEPTLTSGATLILILPNGALTTTKAAYLDFHRQWFASQTWTMEFEPQWTKQSTTMGQVLFRTHYRDPAENAESRNHLIMTFEREASGWKLVSDQNTRIAA
ncbi:MAG: nuclear transport factor 2 family protein [Hyphomonadaceae bacterium]